MITASQKRKENIAEYLLYMWQIEDLIRANDLDIDKIKKNVIDRYDISPNQRKELTEWYESLIDMMRRENIERSGHLQINNNVLNQLVQLHQKLLANPRFASYHTLFYKTLPFIVELRAKSGDAKAGEIETCFNALYALLLMRLQGKEVSTETADAIKQISQFIATLARDYHLDEDDKLFVDDEDTDNSSPLQQLAPQPKE